MNPASGRFTQRDPIAGFSADPPSLHKYTYASNGPANYVDPSGEMTTAEFAAGFNSVVSGAASAARAAFAVSRAAGGAAMRALGMVVENAVKQVLARALPNAAIRQNVALIGQGGRRVLDFWVQIGNRIAAIEVKYALPGRAGATLTRLVSQIRTYTTAAEVTNSNAQVVLFTFNAPTAAQMSLLAAELGPTATPVQLVHGLTGLVSWVRFFFSVSV